MDKDNGGLGIRGLRTMNDTLLLKWWWRFGSEKETLWRQVVCAKYKLDTSTWFPHMEANGNTSITWKDIMQINLKNPLIFNKFKDNIVLAVGNGKQIRFWNDPWTNDNCLRFSFPRIYSICLSRDETLSEVWSRKQRDGVWSFQFRRNFFGWEEEDFNNLITMLDDLFLLIIPRNDHLDHLRWEACNSNLFSVSSLYKLVSSHGIITNEPDRKALQLIWN